TNPIDVEVNTEIGMPPHPDVERDIGFKEENVTSKDAQTKKTILSNTTINPSQKLDLMPEEIKNDEALRNIEVIWEAVNAEFSEENTMADTAHFEISDIHFLPLVVADTVDSDEILSMPEQASMEQGDEPIEEELDALIAEIRELDFLPIVVDPFNAVETEPSLPGGDVAADTENTIEGYALPDIEESIEKTQDSSDTEKSIEGYTLPDLEVNFERVPNPADIEHEETVEADTGDTPEFNLEEAPFDDVKQDGGDDVISWLLANNHLMNIECTYETVNYPSGGEISEHLIPEPVYYDDHETYMMSLLDDLEEMGDQREIPLLQELMAEESKRFIKDRIIGMIAKFNRQSTVKPKTNTPDDENIELPVFSVFADLFKNIDTESKLILLDEVIHVGDEKEIEFLDRLLEDPDQGIRKKAQAVLQVLIAKLSHEKPDALRSTGVAAIVSEYVDLPEVKTAKETETYENLLSEMDIAPSLPPEMLDIDFELNEILDCEYDQKILDIQVVSTEVPPNEYGGSFFNSLRKLSKLF
ncbi:MAG: hypothetical protein WBG48_13675, partial [Pricia sp.]